MSYLPEPLATASVHLPPDLVELTELLARNVHEVWARQRLLEGWKFGPRRDETTQEHPCLVPYDNLPEHEKDYDRRTALETLKTILTLGYRIEKT